MKNLILIILSILIISLGSCSEESNDNNSDDSGNNDITDALFVERITGSSSQGYDYNHHFYYENGRFKKSNLYGLALYEEYNYNSADKIEQIIYYVDDSNNPNNSSNVNFNDPNNFNDQVFISEYEWQTSRSFIRDDRLFTLFADGRLDKVECLTSSSSCETINAYYNSNNEIIEVIFNEGDSSQNVYTYEFDDSINPMNILFLKYGYVEKLSLIRIDFYLPKNPTRVFRNGELIYTAEYISNSEGYPQSATYVRLLNDVIGNVVFTYSE